MIVDYRGILNCMISNGSLVILPHTLDDIGITSRLAQHQNQVRADRIGKELESISDGYDLELRWILDVTSTDIG